LVLINHSKMTPTSFHNQHLRELAYSVDSKLAGKVDITDLASKTITNTADLVMSGSTSKIGVRTIPQYPLDVNGESRFSNTMTNTADLVMSGSTSKIGVRTIPQYPLDVNGESRFSNTMTNTADLVMNGSTSKIGVRTNPQYPLDVNGESRLTTLQLMGGTTSYTASGPVDEVNRTRTYIAFGEAGSTNDFAYLRQLGGPDSMHLGLDFHDSSTDDGRFSIRAVNSFANPDDTIKTLLSVQPTNTTFNHDLNINKSGTGAESSRTLKLEKDGTYLALSPYLSGWSQLNDTSKKDKGIIFGDGAGVGGINLNSRLVIGPHASTPVGIVVGNSGMNVYGKQEIVETGAGSLPNATSGGTLTLRHTAGGSSSIVFPSTTNGGSDLGFIEYKDDINGTTGEQSALIIGVGNDGTFSNDNTLSDSIRMRVISGTTSTDVMSLYSNGIIGIQQFFTNVSYDLASYDQYYDNFSVSTSQIDLTSCTESHVCVQIMGTNQHQGILLPKAFPGRHVTILNNSSQDINVFSLNPQSIVTFSSFESGRRLVAKSGRMYQFFSIPVNVRPASSGIGMYTGYAWMHYFVSTGLATNGELFPS
jgi:hypothetical protein